METALYYTFSTIAQTLAGAAGLLGAFVLFALQQARQRADAAGQRLVSEWPPDSAQRSDLLHLWQRGEIEEVEKRYRALVPTRSSWSGEFHAHLDRLSEDVARITTLRKRFTSFLWVTLSAVALSLLLLPLVPVLAGSVFWRIATPAAALALCAASFVTLGRVLNAVSAKHRESAPNAISPIFPHRAPFHD